MHSFSIGLSGLHAAQAGLDVVGNNVVNAATEGYHRQRVELAPGPYPPTGGVQVAGVTRMIDTLLESEITRQESSYSQVGQELSLLSAVEAALGEFSEGGGVNATIDRFFDALRRLAANPLERVGRHDTISAAQTLAAEFRRLGSSLKSMEDQVVLTAQTVVDTINLLARQIAELNARIQAMEVSQGPGASSGLRDQRDRLITELAQRAGVETVQRENGIVDVSVAGIPIVTGSIVLALTVGLHDGEGLAVAAAGAEGSTVWVEGGQLGGLLALHNELLEGVRADLDALVQAIVAGVNRSHVQGLGLDGSFRELIGWPLPEADLTALGGSITDGTFYLRVTNTVTGEIRRHAVEVQVSGPAPDTPASIAAKIDALDGVSASLTSSRLAITADPGYTFDFIPAVLPVPTVMDFTAAAPPTVSVSGLYSGEENHVFTFTVTGSGWVGNGSLELTVRDERGDLIGTVNVGGGYPAGDVLALPNGLRMAVGMGELNAGDSFQVQALATTDTSGFLAAAGMNAFFQGTSAAEMRVSDNILHAPDRIATAFGGDLLDNAGALRLAALRDEGQASLQGMTPGEYYHRIVADLGQQVALRQVRQENVEAMLQSLRQQRSDLSSVNINDEAAHLLVFEQMFQAAAKYLGTLHATLGTLMDIL